MSLLGEAQALAVGDGDLLGDEIDADDLFGHRMLDLDAGIHFEEIETLSRDIDQEFDRAGAAIGQMLREAHPGGADILAQCVGEARCRRFLDQLLVAALDRAIALAEMDDVPSPSPSTCTSTWRPVRTSRSR